MTKRTEPQREWGLTEDQHNMVTDVVASWRGRVDDLTAQLAAKQERIRELTERCESIFGNERYFDGLSETELEFYSQMSPIEMFRSMLRKDKRIAEIEVERDEWRTRHADCTTELITADRKLERMEQVAQQELRSAKQPAMPEPDWATAPSWAQWWTMDKDGKQRWWEKEPMLDDRYAWWLYDWSKAPYRHERIEYRPDKNGVDWRTLKRRRLDDAQPKEGDE